MLCILTRPLKKTPPFVSGVNTGAPSVAHSHAGYVDLPPLTAAQGEELLVQLVAPREAAHGTGVAAAEVLGDEDAALGPSERLLVVLEGSVIDLHVRVLSAAAGLEQPVLLGVGQEEPLQQTH